METCSLAFVFLIFVGKSLENRSGSGTKVCRHLLGLKKMTNFLIRISHQISRGRGQSGELRGWDYTWGWRRTGSATSRRRPTSGDRRPLLSHNLWMLTWRFGVRTFLLFQETCSRPVRSCILLEGKIHLVPADVVSQYHNDVRLPLTRPDNTFGNNFKHDHF